MNVIRFGRVARIFLGALALATASLGEAQVSSIPNVKTLTLGLVYESTPEAVAERFRPLVEYAARKLAPPGQIKSAVVVAPNALQLIRLIDEESVDIYIESPYPTYIINRAGAGSLFLRRWKSGMSDYRSLIVTRTASRIARLEELRGKLIAFEDAGSTSGYILPKLLLFNKGFRTVEKPGLDAKIAANEVGYIFAATEKNVLDYVLLEKVAAGAISSDDYASLDETTKALLTILGESESLPRHLVSVRRNLSEATVKRLREILLNMHQDEQGLKILRQTDNTTKFDALPGGEVAFRRKLMEVFRPRLSR